MQFRDYKTTFDDFRQKIKELRITREVLEKAGVDPDDYESVYRKELEGLNADKQPLQVSRMLAELMWYRSRRPFFNVYPLIEQKFRELSDGIDMSELVMPFNVMEVRTTRQTTLIGDFVDKFLFVLECKGDAYHEFVISKTAKIKSIVETKEMRKIEETWHSTIPSQVTEEDVHAWVFIAAGTCLLATDESIVTPVILNKHRHEGMTPREVAMYAEKAIHRTGRIGFDVGREMERMKATAHYRNGHFAKFYVGKDHEAYPPNAEASKVPIVKWRSGAIVNKDNVPKVPTGFKDPPTKED